MGAVDIDLAQRRLHAERVEDRVEEAKQVTAGRHVGEGEPAQRVRGCRATCASRSVGREELHDGTGDRDSGNALRRDELHGGAGEWDSGNAVTDDATDRGAKRATARVGCLRGDESPQQYE